MQKIVATLLFALLVPANSFAQEPAFNHHRLIDQFQTRSSQVLLDAATRHARLVAAKEGLQQAPTARSNAVKGTWIGALVGAAAGFVVVSVSEECQPGGYCEAYRLIGVGVGAGVGAVVGYFVGR